MLLHRQSSRRLLQATCEDDDAAVAKAAGAFGVTKCAPEYCEGAYGAMMAPMCPKTCGKCGPAAAAASSTATSQAPIAAGAVADGNAGSQPACEDDDAAVAKAAGAFGVTKCAPEYCEGAYGAMMAPMCPKTCGKCGPAAAAASSTANTCMIAPGPIGGAHQFGMSSGYHNDCPKTPAQQSKWMWPLAWSAHQHFTSLKYGSDEPQYRSLSKVWYRLDKNWKRMDTYWEKGTLRALGQGPCDKKGADPYSCEREKRNQTMLHRQNKMVFIEWTGAIGDVNGVANCTAMDLMVIGNIRPDWYMDKRGDSTDVQYLGNQHIMYEGQPRLVKQWRKQDFADMFFTVSMQAIPGDDGIHWPLTRNDPGEGFGDDALTVYTNHSLLDDTSDPEFLLDEQIEKAGGMCNFVKGDGTSGPPTGEHDVIPSNLVRDAGFRTIVYTASPVWKPEPESKPSNGGDQTWKELSSSVQFQACQDAANRSVQLSVMFDDSKGAHPWAAVSFRKDDECVMTPKSGQDGEVLVALFNEAKGAYELKFGPMPKALKNFGVNTSVFVQQLRVVGATSNEPISKPSASLTDGKLTVVFSFSTDPQLSPSSSVSLGKLSYAVGNDAAMAYHGSRGCFAVDFASLPKCKAPAAAEIKCPVCPVSVGVPAPCERRVEAASPSAPTPSTKMSNSAAVRTSAMGLLIVACLLAGSR
jgi:hypothetical protein